MDLAITFVLAALVAGAVLRLVCGDVSRPRLERFARRQWVVVTVDNGPLIIDYLAVTRRWRAAGFAVGLFVQYGATYTRHAAFDSNLVGPAIGWFAGALIAEWRVQQKHKTESRRTASLTARRLIDYLPRWLVAANVLLWLSTLAMGVAELLHPRPSMPTLVPALTLSVVVMPIVFLVARHVVNRPQRWAAADLIAADDALRGRSLHVLAGCAVATNGVLLAIVTSSGATIGASFPTEGVVTLVSAVCGLAAPLYGWLVATAPSASRRATAQSGIGAAA